MLKKMLFIVCAVLLIPVCANAALDYGSYNFYHAAIRDYNGDGYLNNGDHIRYGFTIKNTDGTWANSNDLEIKYNNAPINGTGDAGGGGIYYENWGMYDSTDASWTQTNYYKGKIYVDDPSLSQSVSLYDRTNGNQIAFHDIAFHEFDADKTPQMPIYNGPDMSTLKYQKVDGGWQFSWDGGYGDTHNSYRFTLSDWSGTGYDIGRRFDNSIKSLVIADELLSMDGTAWALEFQERFANVDGPDNLVWLRSYSGATDFVPTPIPGAAWLFASGLFGLVAVRRKKMMK